MHHVVEQVLSTLYMEDGNQVDGISLKAGTRVALCASYSASDVFLQQMKQSLTCSSTDVSVKALGRPHLYAQHCIMKCVPCTAVNMTEQQPQLWEESICTWQELMQHLNALSPSLPLSLHTCIPRKGPDDLMPLWHPALPDLSLPPPLFPTHSLSGANMQSISPPGFRGVGALPLDCYPLSVFLSLSVGLSSSWLQGEGDCGTLERACVCRGKSGHVGLGERWRERGRKRGKRGRGLCVCRGLPAGLRNTPWQVLAPAVNTDTNSLYRRARLFCRQIIVKEYNYFHYWWTGLCF